uniref:Mechanosensitive ion channel MscS domain-containing protein n=1 Tax=Minutocellus polymorphus TaxID=265543 RepID=A0A7S0AWN5_9STRA|mmetsp:Transcript_5945/g.9974  ORF Transcript_5945/g.9974 Transcript_5945/m.9974 type:complete len:491 (+) Transcript_5945:55-1527(+)
MASVLRGCKASLLLVVLCVTLFTVANGQMFGMGRTKKVDADVSARKRVAARRPWWKKGQNAAAAAIEDMTDMAEDVIEDVQDFVEDVGEMVVASPVFAGKVRPALRKLAITKEKLAMVTKAISDTTQLDDLAFLGVMGWALVPAVEFFYELGDDDDDVEEDTTSDSDSARDANAATNGHDATDKKKPFLKSIAYHIADHFSQFCRIGVGVYAVDVFEILLASLGFNFKNLDQLSEVFAKVAYSVWAAERIKIFKRYLISKAVHRPVNDLGRAGIADHILDAALYGLTAFFLLDWLDVSLGLGIKSMLTFGSAGTLVVSLASKDLAGQLINGLGLAASDKLYEGERIRLDSGVVGVVEKMGWMETTIRLDDEHFLAMGNTELSNKRIINLSRTKQSTVTLTLRFNYNDIDELPKVLDNIKASIRAACPKLIDDGSRPFRVVWSDYGSNHLEVQIEAHFNIPPISPAYHANRENMLHSINGAVKESGIAFKA